MKSEKILKNHLHNHTKMERQVVAKYEKSKYDQNTADFLSYHHHIRFREHIVKWLQILKKKINITTQSLHRKTKNLPPTTIHPQKTALCFTSSNSTLIHRNRNSCAATTHFSISTFCLMMYMKVFYVLGRLKLVGFLAEMKIAE